jgi:hypothetical protein
LKVYESGRYLLNVLSLKQFYADAILSKKGPLARVWLAAHYERKLSKAQTLQTDIGQSASAFLTAMTSGDEPAYPCCRGD